jgi:hypothetical protein
LAGGHMMTFKKLLILLFCFWINYASAAVTTQTSYDEADQQYITLTEDFAPDQNGAPSNIGAWRFGGTANAPFGKTEGPQNGIYYRTVGQEISASYTPSFASNAPSIFSGDYLKENVAELSFSTQVVPKHTPLVRPVSVVLGNTDQRFYLYKSITDCRNAKDRCPETTSIESAWATYRFKIPQSVADAEAENWQVFSDRNQCTKVADCFNQVMSNVQRVEFVYGNPTVYYVSNPLLSVMATNVSIKKRLPAQKKIE